MPPTTCASCHGRKKTARPCKLLKCLHCVCVDCLEPLLSRNGEVRCPECGQHTPSPSPGRSQHVSLPDCPAPLSAGSEHGPTEAAETIVQCEECGEDEPAVSQCADCHAVLCDGHAKMHPRSRTTLKHRMVTLEKTDLLWRAQAERRPAVSSGKFCAIHTSHKVLKFCSVCQDFLCELCLSSGHDTLHRVQCVEEAAEEMRKNLQSLVYGSVASAPSTSASGATGDSSQGEGIGASLGKVSGAIDALHTDTLAVSLQIEEHFASVCKLVSAREQQLLDNLDGLRLAKLLPLQEQRQRLQQCMRQQEDVAALLKSCVDPFDLVSMAGWLEDATKNAIHTADEDQEPCLTSKLMFVQKQQDVVAAAISGAGLVYDATDIDLEGSSLQCPTTVTVNTQFAVTIIVPSKSGQSLQVDDAALRPLEVAATSSDSTIEPSQLALHQSESTKGLEAKYQPKETGTLEITAKYGGGHITGSPARVSVQRSDLSFDPRRCHHQIVLSNGNKTAALRGPNSWKSVCGTEVYDTGITNIRVRLDTVSGGQAVIFLSNSAAPRLDTWQGNSASGWFGNCSSGSHGRGRQLGQQWQSGDVISLTLDCDQHTLTGRHERTGITETLMEVTGNLYLFVSIYHTNGQVTIL